MMTRQIASLWPIRKVLTLANLQDGRPEDRSSLASFPQNNQGGQPVRPMLWFHTRYAASAPLTALPNH
jgi:hypothetical protein